MSVPPVTEDQLLDVPTFSTSIAAHTFGSDPIPSTSYLVRDSEQVTASEALCLLQEGPRTSQSSISAETTPETHDITQSPDVPQPSDMSEDYEVIIPCKTTGADARP